MSYNRRLWSVYAMLLLIALGFRLFVARRLANDEPDDGRVYAQIATNVLEQHVYSHDNQPPYSPSLIRLPGYPLFLAAVYKIFGHGNNTAVRVIQAGIDTLTCVLMALVAFEWTVDDERKHRAATIAFALAAVCPFTAIYVATVLTEVLTNFLAVAMVLAVTFAFKATDYTEKTGRKNVVRKRAFAWWIVSGLIAGLAVLFRPDSGLFAAVVGGTLVLSVLFKRRAKEFFVSACVFSLAFCVVLVPWTIRNYRVFHLFQPLAPAHAEMPGEFVPRGYLLWVRTWLDDSRYVGPALWSVDMKPIHVSDFPDSAFDSDEERDRVAALLDKYNNLPSENLSSSPSPEPDASDEAEEEDEQSGEEDNDTEQQSEPEETDVEMTPEIDAGFAQIGQERRAHHPFRYYIVLPLKRAKALWFDTHSEYYPFNGELLPLADLDHDIHQQFWLPLFAALTGIYSLLGVIGGALLLRSRDVHARRWVLLAALVIFLRLGFFSTLENPEPRYTVELFPFLIILAGAGLALIARQRRGGGVGDGDAVGGGDVGVGVRSDGGMLAGFGVSGDECK
ncbi:MAG TPA: glycosyltransferase family 39 protein [Pyrinomonadaceae bacterium]|nr:glycosyltransferase family 39 protein [Pyrinomonadaceae bacterium]